MKEYEVTKTITTTYRAFVKAENWEEAEQEACDLDVWEETHEKENTEAEEVKQ